jgi:hypothetical protein
LLDQAIIHIGMNKTGSTSIQNSLKNYDDGEAFYARLSHVNHSIPVFTAFANNFKQYHIWLKMGLSEAEMEAKRKKFRQELEAQLSRVDRRRLIISGEDISSLDAAGARDLIDLVQCYAKDIKIVVYVRDPIGFAASSFQQRVKDGSADIPKIIRPNYEKRIAKFIDILGAENVLIRLFSKETLKGGSVVEDFCSITGISMDGIQEVRANESVSLECLKLMFLFNRTNPCYSGDAVVTTSRLKLNASLAKAYKDGQSIDKSRFSAIADFEDGKYLEDNFGLKFSSGHLSSEKKGNRQVIEGWLTDVSEIDRAPLDKMLLQFGILGRFPDLPSILSRLFYHFLYRHQMEAHPVDGSRVIKPVEVRLLRDLASEISGRKANLSISEKGLLELVSRLK